MNNNVFKELAAMAKRDASEYKNNAHRCHNDPVSRAVWNILAEDARRKSLTFSNMANKTRIIGHSNRTC